MHRLIAALFVALAMFISPLAMVSGAGLPLAHGTVFAQTDSHCIDQESSTDGDRATAKTSCAISCATCLSYGPVPTTEAPTASLMVTMANPQFLFGIHPERDTPPPRAV